MRRRNPRSRSSTRAWTTTTRLLADRGIDSHWRLTQSADERWKGPRPMRPIRIPLQLRRGRLLLRPPEWIVPSQDLRGVAQGTYVYEQTFQLDGVDPETASIVGRLSADDVVDHIEINGVNIGQGGASFAGWLDFVVMDHFVAGMNTLRIVVNNHGDGPNPHGLRVELSGSADRKR